MRPVRKQYLVNTRLQLTLILGANALAIISALLLITLMYYAQTHVESYVTALNLRPGHPALQYIAEEQRQFERMAILVIFVQLLVFNVTALLLSHRLAGPLYRLERHLKQVGEGGEPADVHFRKGDLYRELADECNKVMARMRAAAAKA
jgi:signal transduction histidine kinase